MTWEAILIDSGGWAWPLILKRIMPVVRKGLEKRVNLIGQQSYKQQRVINVTNSGCGFVMYFVIIVGSDGCSTIST